MKRFLISSVLFIVFLYLVLMGIDAVYSCFVARSGRFNVTQWRELVHGGIQADVLAMGNSRALHHIDPFVLDSLLGTQTYNLAMDGGPINYQILKYRTYRRHNPKPKLILQNIDYVSMYYGTGMEKEPLLPFWWDRAVRKEIMPYESYPFAEKYIPLYRYHGLNPASLLRRETPSWTKGYDGVTASWDGRAFRQIDSITFIPDPKTETMLEDYLTKAKAEDVQIVFVYTPMFIGATQKLTNLEEMHSYYASIASRFDIPVLDYTWMDICRDTTWFFNALHLNAQGADIFTDSLACDIKRLKLLD